MKNWLLLVSLIGILSGTVITVMAQEGSKVENKEEHKDAASPSTFGSPTPDAGHVAREGVAVESNSTEKISSCLNDPAVLEEIHKMREALAVKQKELLDKENELKAKEIALQDEIKRIENVRDEISKVDTARKKENEEKVTKLVETFETMNPKAASQILSGLDESLAIASMARMSTAKLAKVMNVMEPKRSSRLTELMAGVVRAKSVLSASDAAETTVESGKGVKNK